MNRIFKVFNRQIKHFASENISDDVILIAIKGFSGNFLNFLLTSLEFVSL